MIQTITAADRASGLRGAERKLTVALLALETFDLHHAGRAMTEGNRSDRRLLVDVAAQLCWEYIVQRETNGAIDHQELRGEYAIPDEVWARMGASPRTY